MSPEDIFVRSLHTKVLIKYYSSILSLIFIKILLKLKLDAVHCFYSCLGCLTLLLVFFSFDLPSGRLFLRHVLITVLCVFDTTAERFLWQIPQIALAFHCLLYVIIRWISHNPVCTYFSFLYLNTEFLLLLAKKNSVQMQYSVWWWWRFFCESYVLQG
jgi:hypothetical protein